MERLNILFITPWYPTKEHPVWGVFVQEHAKAVRLYDNVTVIHCVGGDPNLKSLWRIEQEMDEVLSKGIPTYRVWHRRSPVPKTSYVLFLWSVMQAYRRIVAADFRPDIIHAHLFRAGVPAVLIGKLFSTPVVVTEQSTDFPRESLQRLDRWKARIAFEKADSVMPVSQSLQRSIEAYGITARYRVIPNVVDTRLFHPNSCSQLKNRCKRLLVVSLLDTSHKKGIPDLLRALKQVQNQHDDWHLDVVGDGSARQEYEHMATELGLADRITFHGVKPKEEVAQFMRQADFFVLPSLWETFGCVFIEAMASGLPIVSTITGGIPEIVDEEIGILVPPGDVKSLSVALCKMMESLDEFDRQVIVQRSAHYSPESVGGLIHSIYEECVQR